MKDFFGMDADDWSDLEMDIGWDTEHFSKLFTDMITSDADQFKGAINTLDGSLIHQGTLHDETPHIIPFIWKILQYHVEKDQVEFAAQLFKLLKEIYVPEEWKIEPFGFDFEVLQDSSDIFFRINQEIFKPWDVILQYFHSDSLFLKNNAIFFLRYNLSEAKKSIELIRKALPLQQDEGTVANFLCALALLDAFHNIQIDLQTFMNFLHPRYNKEIRLIAFLSIFILQAGNVSDSIAKAAIKYCEGFEEDGLPSRKYTQNLKLNLNGILMEEPAFNLNTLYFDSSGYGTTPISQFYQFYESRSFLYFVRPGANPLINPLLLSIVDKIPKEMERADLAMKNVVETLFSSYFPNGMASIQKSSSPLNREQIHLLNKIAQHHIWQKELFSITMAQYGFGNSQEQFLTLLKNSSHYDEFIEFFFIENLKSEKRYFKYKLDDQGCISDLTLHLFKDLNHITEYIGKLKYLKKLDLDLLNSEVNYSAFATQLHSVEDLRINLRDYSPNMQIIETMNWLKKLYITSSNNQLVIPSLKNYTHLENLSLEITKLKEIPESIKYLTTLKKLFIFHSEIESIPDFIHNLHNLQEIIIDSTKISSISPSICELKNLKELTIQNHWNVNPEIIQLPKCIGYLAQLEKLKIHSIQLESLPESVGNLKNLKELTLSDSNLTQIAVNFSQLQSLEKIEVYRNQITDLPPSILHLKNLQHLNLDHNPIASDTQKLEILVQHHLQNKMKEAEAFYLDNAENWHEIYVDYSPSKFRPMFLSFTHGIYAWFYLHKGMELQNYEMIFDSMGKIADICNSTYCLINHYQNHIILPYFENKENIPELEMGSLLNVLESYFKANFTENDEKETLLNSLNNQTWFYLENGWNLPFCLAVGYFMRNYGNQSNNIEWKCFGMDLIASSYVYDEKGDKIQEAIDIFEEIKTINAKWFSSEMLERANAKLGRPS